MTMVNIEEDLYPEANLHRIKVIIDEYFAHTLETYQKDFQNMDELKSYISRLPNPRDAEKFLEVGADLHTITQQTNSSLRLLELISQIEKIIKIEFVDVKAWINSKNNESSEALEHLFEKATKSKKNEFRKLINAHIFEPFYEKYGITNSFANFIQSYVENKDQFFLIFNFLFPQNQIAINYTSRHNWQPNVNNLVDLVQQGIEIKQGSVPRCYNWRMCEATEFGCHPEEGCLIKENEILFKKTLRQLAKTLYAARSEIVHDASKKNILSGNGNTFTFSMIMIQGKPVVVTTTIDEIERIFITAIKRYFDSRIFPEF